MMVGCRALVPAGGQKTVSLVGKPGGILGNIDKMPVVRLVAIRPNLVCPACDGSEARIANRGANPGSCVLGQAALAQRRQDVVPLTSPADNGRTCEQCHDNPRCREN